MGGDQRMGEGADFLARSWLARRGERRRDFPLYCERVTFFPDVAEHEAITDLYLPLAG